MLIHFNKIKISDDNNYLELDIKVGEESYYKDVTIKKVLIQDKNTYGTNSYVWSTSYESLLRKPKVVSLNIPFSEIFGKISDNILFITVEISGAPTANCPCNEDVIPTAVYVETSNIIKNIEQYTAELNNTCTMPKGFMNYLLLYKALEYSIKTCHYKEAISYLDKLLKEIKIPVTSNCKCNG